MKIDISSEFVTMILKYYPKQVERWGLSQVIEDLVFLAVITGTDQRISEALLKKIDSYIKKPVLCPKCGCVMDKYDQETTSGMCMICEILEHPDQD